MAGLPNPIDEGKRVLETARQREISLRLLGGVAIGIRCTSALTYLRRKYADLDFIGLGSESREVKNLLVDLGYLPQKRFNALHGRNRLLFDDEEQQRHVDIFLDVFDMCHTFNLKGRLTIEPDTLTLADLLATKLQIAQINIKDYIDLTALLLDHDIGDQDSYDKINGTYLSKICSDDWGVYKDFRTNLDNVLHFLDNVKTDRELSDLQIETVSLRVNKLLQMIESTPKSVKWKMRAKIGEKMPWNKLPEEVVRATNPLHAGSLARFPHGPYG